MPMSEKQLENLAKARAAAKAKREAAAQQLSTDGIGTAEVVEEISEMPMVEDEYTPPPAELERLPEMPLTPFEGFVASLPDETRELLSIEELQEAFDTAEREARAEKRKTLKAQAVSKAKDHAKAAAGLLTPEELARKALAERMAKPTRITVRMPFLSDTGGQIAEGVTIDGTTYRHGESYTVPYGRALAIRDIIFRGQQAEMDFEGKGRLHGLRQQRAGLFNEVRF